MRRLGGLTPVRVDCRILCATNQDLPAKIKAGTFREELYYRLSVVTVKLPPLRERPEDIPHLARFFLERFSRRYGKSLSGSPQFYDALLKQRWPGNVRQLKNVVERLTALHPGGVLGRRIWKRTHRRWRQSAVFPLFHGRMHGNNIWPALRAPMRMPCCSAAAEM